LASRKSPKTKARAPRKKASSEGSDGATRDDESQEDAQDSEDAEGDEDPSSSPDGADDSAEAGDEDIVEAEAEVVEDVDLDGDVDVGKLAPTKGSRGGAGAITRTDPLQLYMNEIQRHPLLTPDEEHKLAVRYTETQDVDTAARLVTANLRLVVKLAYEYRRAYRNIMDLIQEGNIGLMQAVKRYDPYRGVKLSSYAAWWIRAYMLRFILNNWRLVKIGTTQAQRRLFFNLNKEKARLSAMGIEPTHAAIASSLRVEEKDVIEMDRRLARGDASLDAPVGDNEGRKTTRMELLPSTGEGPESVAESAELSEIVRGHLDEFRKTLQGKELVIFDKRVVAEDPLTLQELGDEFGVSRERVRQLEARLTGKLRDYLKASLGDAVEVGA
jgi:RNA polymerase sigma-32 factor